jgi:DnaJ-like protein
MRTFDEEIARHLQDAAESGELSRAESYGKPLPDDPGWNATPDALRMPMKILKDAGATPPEIEWFHERARLKDLIATTADPVEREKLQTRLIEVEQKIAIRLEALRIRQSL